MYSTLRFELTKIELTLKDIKRTRSSFGREMTFHFVYMCRHSFQRFHQKQETVSKID